jgi:DNA-binding response OmpR family regulator
MTKTHKVTVLVADDEASIRQVLSNELTRAGFDVVTASDGEESLEAFTTHAPALVVLDVSMPKVDGWEVLRELRQISEVPVLMLTAHSLESDQLTGFGLGADDYVTKPFSLRQVIARVKAILKRTGLMESKKLVAGPIELNPESREVTAGGTTVELTGREYALLEILMRNPGRVFSRGDLLSRCWEPGYDGVDRVVDVHMASLRRKLGEQRDYISTIRGVGYKFNIP